MVLSCRVKGSYYEWPIDNVETSTRLHIETAMSMCCVESEATRFDNTQ